MTVVELHGVLQLVDDVSSLAAMVHGQNLSLKQLVP
jgi:hypothetical protein